MNTTHNNHKKEKLIQIVLIVLTFIMIILRFLLNEKGRVTPDSIRFMRFSNSLPVIDNTTTPLGYPIAIKLFVMMGLDPFWSSKVVGILAYFILIGFSWKKKFFFREIIIIGALFSFVSLFAATLSEALTLPFILFFLYISWEIINGKFSFWRGVLLLSLSLIAIYNIRYSALFMMGACFVFGLLNVKKNYGKVFILSSFLGALFIVLYKLLFIDTFNKNYVNQALEMGYYPTSKLVPELFKGLATTFNPFVHIANPNGGIINMGIYGIGVFVIGLFIFLISKKSLSNNEKLLFTIGIIGIICSFFIQYVYVIDALDYRLLSMFSFPIWLLFFKKLYENVGTKIYAIAFLSLGTGFIFTWLSKGNYLENRSQVSQYLKEENLMGKTLKFYANGFEDSDSYQLAELFSTVNPETTVTFNKQDTIQPNVLTKFKVLKKIKVVQNKYQ